ncbi:hypothetical protein Hanom_Chr01g00064551 [Helianthus anomalus]
MATAGEHDDGVANRNVVYLDTTLDTHLALIVSDSDTVSDFKRKIMLEHHQLFPAIGDVKVECVKVKRKGSFYHLSDSMLVKSAFSATKGNWFASVDASRLEQNDGIQQLSKHKVGDQLALPWVTQSRSIERHDNHGSPSVHSKTAPLETASLVNQKVLNFDQLTSGDSCKDVSKNAEEDRLCNDKLVDCEPQEKLDTVNTDVNSKKRTRDVHNESPLQDAFGYGPSVKKKRKTQRGKSDTEDATKKKKKRKNKKTAGRNEDESITKLVNHDVCENVKEGESGLLDTDRKDGEREKHEDSEKTLIDAKKGDDVIVKEVEVSLENIEEKSRKEITDTNDAVTVTNEDNLLPHSESPVNNDADISTGMNKSQVNVQGILDNVEKQNEKMDDTTKNKRKKKSKTKRSSGRNEDESVTKHVDDDVIENVKEAESSLPDADRKDGDKANKTDKPQDLQSKHQSTDVELESKKSQSVDHHHLPEKTSKNVTASELSKVNNEVEIPENESKFFVDSREDMKNTKVDSGNDRSQKLVSKNENSNVSVDVIKDPNITNIDKFKTPKRTRKIDAQKTNRQQLPLVQSRVKTVEKKKVSGLQKVKSLLNTPGTIFGDDGDSDSSTQAPSHKSSSSSSSSSEEDSSYSLYSIRNRSHARNGMEGAGKNNINSQNESKSPILGKLLRSSSAFKKAKVTASQVEDTVEFVPDSQP